MCFANVFGRRSPERTLEGQPRRGSFEIPSTAHPVLSAIRSLAPHLCKVCKLFDEYDPMLLTRFKNFRFTNFAEREKSANGLAVAIVKQCNGMRDVAQLVLHFRISRSQNVWGVFGVMWFGEPCLPDRQPPGRHDVQQLAIEMRNTLSMTWAPLYDERTSTRAASGVVQTFRLDAQLLSPAMQELYSLLKCFQQIECFSLSANFGNIEVTIVYRTTLHHSIPASPLSRVHPSILRNITPRRNLLPVIALTSPSVSARVSQKPLQLQVPAPVPNPVPLTPIELRRQQTVLTPSAVRILTSEPNTQPACEPRSPGSHLSPVRCGKPSRSVLRSPRSQELRENVYGRDVDQRERSNALSARDPALCSPSGKPAESNRDLHSAVPEQREPAREYKQSPASPLRQLGDYDISEQSKRTNVPSSLQISGAKSVHSSQLAASDTSR